jgi:hypothetical protein
LTFKKFEIDDDMKDLGDFAMKAIERKNNMRFAIYNDQTKRLTRVIIMLFLKFSFRLDMIT